jgi:hypothetical protein
MRKPECNVNVLVEVDQDQDTLTLKDHQAYNLVIEITLVVYYF